jgi:hypothetical protein
LIKTFEEAHQVMYSQVHLLLKRQRCAWYLSAVSGINKMNYKMNYSLGERPKISSRAILLMAITAGSVRRRSVVMT